MKYMKKAFAYKQAVTVFMYFYIIELITLLLLPKVTKAANPGEVFADKHRGIGTM